MSLPRIAALAFLALVAVLAYALWPRPLPPDPPADGRSLGHMWETSYRAHVEGASLLGGAAVPVALTDGPPPWWAATAPKASAQTR